LIYFVTYPGWQGHWHQNYNQAINNEFAKAGIDYRQVTIDWTSHDIHKKLQTIQNINSSWNDSWLLSTAQNPIIELLEHKPGYKFGHIHSLECYPFETAVLQGVSLEEPKRFGYYDRLFLSSQWSLENAVNHYPQYSTKFHYTGFPIDFKIYQPYRHHIKKKNLVVFNQRFSWERLPLIEIELARRLNEKGYEVQHLYAPGSIKNCFQLQRFMEIGQNYGLNFVANHTKEDYHLNLSRAEFIITTSICDNLPLSLIEAIYLKAIPAAPRGMCFPEFVHQENLYNPYYLEEVISIVTERPEKEHYLEPYDKAKVIKKYLELMM